MPSRLHAALYTAAALVAFSGNSILGRLALGSGSIDPATFSTVRLASGALILGAVLGWSGPRGRRGPSSWRDGLVLFVYAIPFSFAYVRLTAGTGALLLFGAVQVTMIVAALRGGEAPHLLEWGGLMVASAGLVYLVLPGLAAPSPLGSALMVASGVFWGIYSLLGRGSVDPIAQIGGAFARAAPLALLVNVLALPWLHVTARGVGLAVIAGALTSGLGYVLWYRALGRLSATSAAVVQLAVPVLAAAGGVALIGEPVSLRLALAGAVVLGGISLAVAGGARRRSVRDAVVSGPAGSSV